MQVGVVGLGRIGQFHARALQQHPSVHGLSLFDLVPEQSAAGAEMLSCAAVPCSVADSMAELLETVDAVAICASTSAHAALLEQAIRAGVPTFCEKPVTLDLASTRRLATLAAERDAVVQVGFQRRFDAGYMAARAAVAAGRVGTVYSVRVAGHDPAPPRESYLAGSGGIFRDLHIHDFDIVPWVLGDQIEEVYVRGAVRVDPMFARAGDVDTVAGTFVLASGALGALTGGRHDPLGYDIRLEVLGSKDSLVVGWDSRLPMHSVEPDVAPLAGPPYTGFLDRFAPAYRAELTAFVELCEGRRANPCPIAEAERALCVALACDRSLAEGRAVLVQEIAG